MNEGIMFSLEDFLNLTDENKERFKEIIKEIILDHIDENEDIRKGVSIELLEESLKSIKNLKWSIDSEKIYINQTLKKIMYIKWLSNNLENSSILMENI